MDFSTPAFSNRPERAPYRTGLFCALCGWLVLTSVPAQAAPFSIEHAEFTVSNKVYELSARIEYRLSEKVLEALESGVPLFIALDIEVKKHRKWWKNATIALLEQRYLLLYHALSEKYVLNNLNSGAQQNFSSLPSALDALGTIRGLPLIDQNLLDSKGEYFVRMRTYLDIDSLPPPIQPIAYLSSDWRLESEWHQWSLKQ